MRLTEVAQGKISGYPLPLPLVFRNHDVTEKIPPKYRFQRAYRQNLGNKAFTAAERRKPGLRKSSQHRYSVTSIISYEGTLSRTKLRAIGGTFRIFLRGVSTGVRAGNRVPRLGCLALYQDGGEEAAHAVGILHRSGPHDLEYPSDEQINPRRHCARSRLRKDTIVRQESFAVYNPARNPHGAHDDPMGPARSLPPQPRFAARRKSCPLLRRSHKIRPNLMCVRHRHLRLKHR